MDLVTRTPCCCTCCGSREMRLLDLVLDLDLGDVGIGALGEGGGDADRAARARGSSEIEQAVDPGQLLLDDLGDAVLDGLRPRRRDSWRGC